VLIIPPAIRQAIVDAAVADATVLDGVTCGLFLSSYTPSMNSTFAELEAAKATFSGYAVFTPVVWSAAYLDANKTAYSLGGLIEFLAVAATPFVPNNIGGYYLYSGTSLRAVEQFTDPVSGLPTPVQVTFPGAIVPVIPRFSFGQ